MPTLCGAERTGSPGRMESVGSKAFCFPLPPETPKEGPSQAQSTPRGMSHPQRDLAPSCQVPTLNHSSLGLRGLGWGRRKRSTSSYDYSGSAHKYQLYLHIISTITLCTFNT